MALLCSRRIICILLFYELTACCKKSNEDMNLMFLLRLNNCYLCEGCRASNLKVVVYYRGKCVALEPMLVCVPAGVD
jgi:hypothetical protein